MGEREREREREREKSDNYDWHYVGTDIFKSQSGTAWVYIISSDLLHTFLSHVAIHISEPFFFVLLNPGATGAQDDKSCLLSWPLLSCHYIIFWMPTHFSWDSFPLSQVYTSAYPILKSLTNQSVKCQYVTDLISWLRKNKYSIGWVLNVSLTLKMVLDTSLLNTQQYKVRINGKVEQSKERSSTLPNTSV